MQWHQYGSFGGKPRDTGRNPERIEISTWCEIQTKSLMLGKIVRPRHKKGKMSILKRFYVNSQQLCTKKNGI